MYVSRNRNNNKLIDRQKEKEERKTEVNKVIDRQKEKEKRKTERNMMIRRDPDPQTKNEKNIRRKDNHDQQNGWMDRQTNKRERETLSK
jgi:hypothetical protein